MYLLRELAEINAEYLVRHALTDNDVQDANAFVRSFEGREDSTQPRPGDMVNVREIFRDSEEFSPVARIEHIRNGKASICLQLLSSPHVIETTGALSISGGRWVSIPLDELIYEGRVKAKFWMWGERGYYSAGGGVTFFANVRKFSGTVDNPKKDEEKLQRQYAAETPA
jgi:hypothetical protein